MPTYTSKGSRKFKPAGRTANRDAKSRKSFSSNLSTNYALMLQLYSLNKQNAEPKKELKAVTLKPAKTEIETSRFFIPGAGIISRLIKMYDQLTKDGKPGFVIAE